MMKFYLCCNLYNLYEFKAFNLEMQVFYNIEYQFFVTIAFVLIFIYMNLHIYM